MARWEYKLLNGNGAMLEHQLNDLGGLGWEVVAATPREAHPSEGEQAVQGAWHWAVMLKREIPDALSGVRAHHADQRQAQRDDERDAAAAQVAAEGRDLA